MKNKNQLDSLNRTSREVARTISNNANASVERKQADLTVRPLRLAFIIREDLLSENLLHLLTCISSIWGGYYSCLVPTDGKTISDVDWESLNFYEPDKVVFCSNGENSFSAELINKIQNERLPFSIIIIDDWNPDKDIFNLEMKRDSDSLISSIPLIVPMQHNLNKQKQPITEDKSRVRIPKISQDHSLALYVAAQVGAVSDFNKNAYLNGFKAKEIEFVTNEVKDYLSLLAEFENNFSPLSMTQLYTRTTITMTGVAERPEGLSIVLVGDNIVRDLCMFWNLRLSQIFFKESVLLLLPFDMLQGNKNLQDLCGAIKLAPWYHRRINIFSGSVDKRRLKRFEKRLKEKLGLDVKIYLENSVPVAYFQTKNIEETAETTIEEKSFSFKCPKPEFFDLVSGGEWAVDIKFSQPYEYPAFAQINHLLCGSSTQNLYVLYKGYWIRNAHEKFVHRANNSQDFVKGYLISDKQGYKEVFQDKGFSTRLTEKHSYMEGFLSLLQSPDILEDHYVRDFFWKLQKPEAYYTYDDLRSELKKGDEGGALIDDFVAKRILIRGMALRCGACGLLRFYPINTLDEEMQCPGCLKLLQPPSRAPIMFRLNELASRAVEQGSIPVILTHKFLKNLSQNHTLHVSGVEVTKDDLNMEVDYITTNQGNLVFVECKDFKSGVLLKEKKNAVKQLASLVGLAKQMESPVIILSTLLPHPSPDYTDIARQIERMRTKSNLYIHLLSLSGNGIVNLKAPEKLVKTPFLFY